MSGLICVPRKKSRTATGPTIRSEASSRSRSEASSPRATARRSAASSGRRRLRSSGIEQLAELRVVAALGGQARVHRRERRGEEALQVLRQHRLEVACERARVDVLEGGQLAEGLDHERQLRGPAPVDRGLADAGALRDALDGERREADLGEQLERGVEDGLVGDLAARAGRRSALRCCVRPSPSPAPSPTGKRPDPKPVITILYVSFTITGGKRCPRSVRE